MHCLTPLITCPICHMHVTRVGNSLKCERSHTFDISKEGYVNLQRTKLSGDTKEMLIARRNFLERGHYAPLVTMLHELIADYLHRQEQLQGVLPDCNLLDIGCGEGYYLGEIQRTLTRAFADTTCCYVGLDVSKDAIRMAAKRYRDVHFVVANVKERLPFANDAFHILLNIFAPRNSDEFVRITMLGGIVIIVIPTPVHLAQVRNRLRLLQIEENKQAHVTEQLAPHFTLMRTNTLAYTVHLQQAEIVQAVMMTPNYWHLSEEQRAELATLQEIETSIGFTCLLFERV